MGMKTNLSKNDLEKIISNYDIGKYRGFKIFARGGVQTTLLLITTKGKYVLRYYEHRSKDWVLFEIKLSNYLKMKKYPLPGILKNYLGKFISEYKNKPYVIMEYSPGKHYQNPNNSFNKKRTLELIKVISELHKLTKNHSELSKGHEQFNIKYCLREYRKISRKIDVVKREKWLKNELNKLEFPKSLPSGICHADLNHGNFLFINNKIIAVLDFDMAFYTNLIYDLASAIYWWAWPPKKGFILYRAKYIVKNYSKFRGISLLEKKHIYDYLKLIILLGIAWSEDKDFEPEKEKIEFLNSKGREEFYNNLS